MSLVFALIRGALAGAFLAALGVFLYRGYILHAAGASLTAVPLPELLLEVMALHHYAAIGALVGAAAVFICRLFSLAIERRRSRVAKEASDVVDDGKADAKIRSLRKAKAEHYLAERKRKKR